MPTIHKPGHKSGRWSPSEDSILISLVNHYLTLKNDSHLSKSEQKTLNFDLKNAIFENFPTNLTNLNHEFQQQQGQKSEFDGFIHCSSGGGVGSGGLAIPFAEIVKRIPGRTAKQAQERWENHLRSDLKHGEWDYSETHLLLEMISKHGQDWSLISKVLPQRGFDGIKVKGRSLLKETMPKKKQSEKKRTKPTGWDDNEIKSLIDLHKKYGEDVEQITKELDQIRPVAEVDRELLSQCKCDLCTTRYKMLKSDGSCLKTAWSKEVAAKLLKDLEVQHELLNEISKKSIDSRSTARNTDSPSVEELPDLKPSVSHGMENTNGARFYVPLKEGELFSNHSTSSSSVNSENVSNFMRFPSLEDLPDLDDLLNDIPEHGNRIKEKNYDNILRDLGHLDYLFRPVRKNSLLAGQHSISDPGREQKREDDMFDIAELLSESSDLGHAVFAHDNDVLGSLELPEPGEPPELSKRTRNGELVSDIALNSEFPQQKKLQFLNMIHNFAKAHGIQSFEDTFRRFHSDKQLNRMLNSSRLYGRTCLTNPGFTFLLEAKFAEKSVDPRYQTAFLLPNQEHTTFDPNLPIGSMMFQVGTCLCLDADDKASEALKVSTYNNKLKGQHWFTLQASSLNAFYLLGLFYPILATRGQVWCRQIFMKGDGSVGVYLVKIQFNPRNTEACMFKLQDQTEKFGSIAHLPPDL